MGLDERPALPLTSRPAPVRAPIPADGRPALAVAALLVAVVALSNIDLLTGEAVPAFRDLGSTQIPARALFSSLGRASTLPHASFGQPYLGNPNFVLAYPAPRDPRWIGVHLLVHLGLGLLGAYVFFRRLTASRDAAALGAFAWGLSGFTLSSSAFLNVATTLAYAPWLLACAALARERTGRRLALPLLGFAAATALMLLGGEPALAALAGAVALAFALTGPPGTRTRSVFVVAGGALLAALVTAPWLLEVARASAFSSRRVRGFSWREFSAVGVHPARLLETPFPGLFGDPSRLLSGAFWGFRFTQENPPYAVSVSLGVVPLALALLFAASPRRREGRFFLGLALAGALLCLVPWLPGARALYEALTPLHSLRYPGKAFLGVALGVAGLAALGADRFASPETLPRFRLRAATALLAAAALLAILAVWGRVSPDGVQALLRVGWDPTWRSDPGVVLAPIAARLPLQAAFGAGLLAALALFVSKGGVSPRVRALLLVATAADLLAAGRSLLPRVPASLLAKPSPLVGLARSLGGRVYEAVPKDTDAVRRGLYGRYPSDDFQSSARARLAQGWSIAGAAFGLRYAFDPSPDMSYSIRTRVATDVVALRDGPLKLKWLRASGVHAILAGTLPDGLEGVEPVATFAEIGVPTTLYRVASPLPGTRRASRVFAAATVEEEVARFERADFDPATDVVVAGRAPDGLGPAAIDASATARVVREEPDVLEVETSGGAPALLLVDRAYTPRVAATVNGTAVVPRIAQVHLVGVPVPAGRSRVALSFAR